MTKQGFFHKQLSLPHYLKSVPQMVTILTHSFMIHFSSKIWNRSLELHGTYGLKPVWIAELLSLPIERLKVVGNLN